VVVGTIGELSIWYKVAHIAFIGNSLDYKSIKTGKNPFEAVQENCVVIHGPKMLEPGYNSLLEEGVSEEVFNRYDISNAVIKYSLLGQRRAKVLAGRNLLDKNKKLVDDFITIIKSISRKRER
jgi:3-deoxy-D-manno-octulosonic-acid transferase